MRWLGVSAVVRRAGRALLWVCDCRRVYGETVPRSFWWLTKTASLLAYIGLISRWRAVLS